ncbi:MAG TPA: hopanoid biosynthesis-associated protein HpnK [Candidatus Brocadiales bacterium]|nr:hopanoid biosynthesis-associated protein HpnK [Candidatus Brocadiales bacterium]
MSTHVLGEHAGSPLRNMQRLIITGDDFGLSSGVNHAIIKAHQEGILTSASLMATGRAFEEAVGLARANPGLSVGLHIVLLHGKSVLSHEKIPHLVDPDGNFPNNSFLAGTRYFFSKEAQRELREELRAQIERFLSTELRLAFLSGHLNVHVHPTVFGILIGLAQEFGIRAFRLPREGLLLNLKADRSRPFSKLFHYLTFYLLSRHCKKTLSRRGFLFTDRVYGLLQYGEMNAGYIRYLLGHLPQGVTEIYFHPCILPCQEFTRWMPDYHPTEELGVLTSSDVKGLIKTESIQLADYSVLST